MYVYYSFYFFQFTCFYVYLTFDAFAVGVRCQGDKCLQPLTHMSRSLLTVIHNMVLPRFFFLQQCCMRVITLFPYVMYCMICVPVNPAQCISLPERLLPTGTVKCIHCYCIYMVSYVIPTMERLHFIFYIVLLRCIHASTLQVYSHYCIEVRAIFIRDVLFITGYAINVIVYGKASCVIHQTYSFDKNACRNYHT